MSESPEDIRNPLRPLDLKLLTAEQWESLEDEQSEKIDAIKEVFDEQLADCRYLIKQTSERERSNSIWRGRFKTLLILLTSGVAFANVAGQVTDKEEWVNFAVFVSLTATLFASMDSFYDFSGGTLKYREINHRYRHIVAQFEAHWSNYVDAQGFSYNTYTNAIAITEGLVAAIETIRSVARKDRNEKGNEEVNGSSGSTPS